MRKDIFLYIVGLLVFVVPFLGVPEAWKSTALFVLGACVILGAFACRITIRRLERSGNEYYYEENTPSEESIRETREGAASEEYVDQE